MTEGRYLLLAVAMLTLASCSDAAEDIVENTVTVRAVDDSKADASDPAEWEDATVALAHMGVGWNLGNTLDPIGAWIKQYTAARPSNYETAWGQPVTQPAMFKTFKEAGFGFIRLPVSWGEKTDASYTVKKAWMDRVQEVVDYILEADMYCILNVHHDTGTDGWLHADPAKYEENSIKFKAIWAQIAERFKDYDYHLLFEGFNEILDADNNWSNSDAESYATVNRLNQDFVNTVRASDSENNRHRNLIVNTYSASCTQSALDAFVLPTDSVCSGRIAAEFHMYSPYNFALNEELDGDGNKPAHYQYDEFLIDYQSEIKSNLQRCQKRFVKKHIPCIMGEFGATDKNNESERAKHAAYNTKWATKYGITVCYWMGLMDGEDRTNCVWTAPLVKDAIIDAYRTASSVTPIYE